MMLDRYDNNGPKLLSWIQVDLCVKPSCECLHKKFGMYENPVISGKKRSYRAACSTSDHIICMVYLV